MKSLMPGHPVGPEQSVAPGGSPRRRRGGIGRWVGAGAVAMALGLGAFYAAWWPRLEALPELARARVAVHGGRWVPLSQVSPWFIRALIATEDQSFWTNWGVSFEGTARALVVDLKAGRFVQGGSTLTQQLVRDLYLSPRKTIPRKMTGILLALMAARLYSKTQILTAYINEVYLGAGAWGVAQASERYFGVAPSALTPAQATLLAGLPEAPSSLNPLRHLARAKARQREVLDSLLAVHWITPAEARAIWRAPLGLRRPAP